jgi:predicted  nucleic acid-binding Zn-ribbon protein
MSSSSPMTAIAASFFSFLAGAGLVYALLPGPPPAQECPTAEAPNLDALCAGRTPDAASAAQAAQAQVQTLSAELATKEAELAAARADAEKSTDAKDAASAKAKKLEAEIGALKGKLSEATSERDRLVAELRDTLVKLDEANAAATAAQGEVRDVRAQNTGERWSRFVAEAKVELCEKGTVKRHETCHEAVAAAFDAKLRDRYVACVNSRQATPSLGQLEKGQSLPAFAVALPDDKAFTSKGWYVLLCDPTLPEATDPNKPSEPDAKPTAKPGAPG